jgi:hypothetical protein
MANIPRLRAVFTRRNAECLDTALIRQLDRHRTQPTPQTPKVVYCYYKLVTNLIREVKIHVCHTLGIQPRISDNQHSGLKPPSL